MSAARREYKTVWIAKKRRELRAKRKIEAANLESSDSNSDEESIVQTQQPLFDVASGSHCEDHLCSNWSSQSSSDESLSDRDCWTAVDQACSQFSDSSESDDELCKIDLKTKLQAWAVDCNVTHSQLDKLLPILKDVDKSLPSTAKTLLKHSSDVPTEMLTLSGGDYVYIGVREGLTSVVTRSSPFLNNPEVIELTMNIDGLPLFRSSSYSLWPILCCAANLNPRCVFVIALYGGKSKPANLDFLKEAVQELRDLLDEGFVANGKHFCCTLKMCICDAPARAMVKCVKQYSGYFGCDKCTQKGDYEGRLIYPECDASLRDDNSFRLQTNSEHHTGVSPLCSLPIDMVNFFPVDYMHQVCLGVMKRLLVCWTGGLKKVKLSVGQKLAVNSKLEVFRHVVTSDFSRKPRTLNDLAHWKATEFRTFLLYIGYFVLHKIMSDRVLEHFLCLSVACRILVSEKLAAIIEYRSFAHELLLYFVEQAADIYGREFLVYNVHSLVHISREVELFGSLDNSSAFVFENFMQVLKKYARSGKKPLIQVCHRLKEHSLYSSPSLLQHPCEQCELQHLTYAPPNNSCILVADGRCCQVVSKSQKHVTCMVFSESELVFSSPIESQIVGIHKVKLSCGVLKHLPLNALGHKAMCYPQYSGDYLVFIELLHAV
jgi:hypothetical protein